MIKLQAMLKPCCPDPDWVHIVPTTFDLLNLDAWFIGLLLDYISVAVLVVCFYQSLCLGLILQARGARPSLPPLHLHPLRCHPAQKLRSLSLFSSLWLPACWCLTPTLSSPMSCPPNQSRRAALRGCSRYKPAPHGVNRVCENVQISSRQTAWGSTFS